MIPQSWKTPQKPEIGEYTCKIRKKTHDVVNRPGPQYILHKIVGHIPQTVSGPQFLEKKRSLG